LTVLVSMMLQHTAGAQSQSPLTTGKVLTPVGELDAVCVHEIPNGARVDRSGHVLVNNAVVATLTLCDSTHPAAHLPPSTGSPSATPGVLPTTNGWVEASIEFAPLLNGLQAYNYLSGYFYVPALPVNRGQTVFFFPSIMNDAQTEIIQPVLQFGPAGNPSFGGNYWSFASWYVIGNNGFHSTPIRVNVGDKLYGQMYLLDHHTGFDLWDVYSEDVTAGTSTDAGFTTAPNYDNIQGAVLEAHNLSTCDSYPSTNLFYVFDFAVYQEGPYWNNYNAVTPNLQPMGLSPVTPSCAFTQAEEGGYATFLEWTY